MRQSERLLRLRHGNEMWRNCLQLSFRSEVDSPFKLGIAYAVPFSVEVDESFDRLGEQVWGSARLPASPWDVRFG